MLRSDGIPESGHTDGMAFDPEQRRAALRDFMLRTGLKPTPWEKAAELGEGTLRKFLDGTSDTLTDRSYSKLASGASKLAERTVHVQELQDHNRSSGDLSTEVRAIPDERQKIVTAPPLPERAAMDRDIPVLGTSLAGREGDFQMNNGDPIDFVRRPPHLAGRQDLKALYVQGDSMKPWKRPGQLVFFDNKPPQNGDHVVIELRPSGLDDERPAFLKVLLGVTPTKIKLAQYRPAREFEIPRSKVHKIWRVLEVEELLGF